MDASRPGRFRRCASKRRRPLALLLLLSCSLPPSWSAIAETVAEPAPDFVLPSVWVGNERLSEHRGEVVVLAFWSSRCSVCDAHVERLDDIVRALEDEGARLIVVSIDREPDAGRELDAQLRARVLLDDERRVARLYDLGKLPVTHLVDFHGRLRTDPRTARDLDPAEVRSALVDLLRE